MTFPRLALATGLIALACAAQAQTAPTKTYIVQLADAPVATYAGGVSGLASTRPSPGSRLNVNTAKARAYMNFLEAQRVMTLSKVGNVPVLYRFNVTMNGFAAQLTDAQAKALKGSTNVVSVTLSQSRKLDTVSTPSFLGLNAPGGLWSQVDAASRPIKGEDIIIGVIDSGVWPEDTSFGDRVNASGQPLSYAQPGGTLAYGPPPAKWLGTCTTGPGFTAAMCNNKLIGARYYVTAFDATFPGYIVPLEYRSPRDANGHGSHTASTAGGNSNVTALVDDVNVGVMSGIAPRARVAAYKVCWTSRDPDATGCAMDADIIAAIEDAVKDGVDVINYSISGTQTSFVDPVEIAFLNATAAGVFVAASAGNDGPANTVAHISPWLMTVAASTHNRYTVAPVVLGNGATYSGPSYQTSGVPSTPLVRSIDVTVGNYATMSQADKTAAERCYLPEDGGNAQTALDPLKVAGKMVICYRGGNVLINKAATVKNAGGVAMIIQNVPAIGGTPASNNSTVLQPYVIPTVHLTNDTYAPINTYVTTTAGPTASFGPGVQQTGVIAPVMADFSSRGPNKANANILKPDITGPGVDIIAAYVAELTQLQHDALIAGTYTPPANANSLQGTSMSSPHVAGAAALLRQAHPTWSPAAIKSALMTTTTPVYLASGATDPNRWGYGSGHMNPNGATSPSLVYNLTAADYGKFLCGLSLTPPPGIGNCGTLGSIQPWNLNLASLTAAGVAGTQTLTRTVTNVGNAQATYVASWNLPGWDVAVNPSSITLAPGASKTFAVTLTRTSAAVGTWTFGSLAWNDGVTQVTSPLSARALAFTAPTQVADVRASGKGTKVFGVVSSYNGTLSVIPTGLVPATRTAGQVAQNATQCFNFAVGAGAQVARFQLFNADTQQGSVPTDLDLTVYNGPDGTGSAVGSSGGATAEEVVTLNGPAAGTYSACVDGYAVPTGGAAYTLSSWVVGPAVGVQTLKASGPSQVYAGGTGSIALGWSVPAGQRYLGNVQFRDAASALLGSTIVFVDNH